MKIIKITILASIAASILIIASCSQKSNDFKFDTFSRADSTALVPGLKSPQCNISVTIEYPTSTPKEIDINALNAFIQQVTFDTTDTGGIQKAYDSYVKKTTSSYNSLRPLYKEMKNEATSYSFASFSWQMSVKGRVSFPNKTMIGYDVTTYSFTGGAHGMETVKSYIINRATGATMGYSDLFSSNAHKELSTILADEAIKQYSKEIFFEEAFIEGNLAIEPCSNIRFTETTVDFIYQRYELAPYSAGLITISIPMKRIEGLLMGNSEK